MVGPRRAVNRRTLAYRSEMVTLRIDKPIRRTFVAKVQAPERVVPGVYRVDTVGLSNTVSVLILEDEDGFTLVDIGLESSVGRIQSLPTVPVDRVAREGDVIVGFRVVSTPGHTLGHTSLLRDEDGLLFTD